MCRQRIGDRIATETILIHSAVASIIGGKTTELNKALNEVRDG